MSYIGSYKIDDALTFYVNTHSPSTGAASDADSAPTYRVYEDETGTPILTGTMALLDDANTVGLYSEQITLSAANGFEKGKCYCIRILATVSTIAASVLRFLQIEAEVDVNTLSDAAGVRSAVGLSSANLDTQLGTIDTNVDSALADTNELQTDWVNGGRLDNILDARASQTSVDDLPTNAELATALGTADDAVLAQVALVKAVTDALPDAGALTTIQADLDNIQTRIPAALTADGNIKADTLRVNGTAQTAGDLAALSNEAINLLEGDVVIDTSGSPWKLIIYAKGTYGGLNTVLLSQDLFQVNGDPYDDNETQKLGQKLLT